MFGGLVRGHYVIIKSGLSQLENCDSGHPVKVHKTSTPQNMT